MQKSQFLFILSLILAVIVTIFALTNSSPVVINFFFYKFTGSLALVIFLSAMLGALVVMLLGIARFIRFKMDVKKLVKERDGLVREKDTLTKQVVELTKKMEDSVNAASNQPPIGATPPPASTVITPDNISE